MAKRGGYAGGVPGNMNNMLKQAQRMQRQMEEKQKELEEKVYTGSAGGGAVSVELTGGYEINSVRIDPDTCDPDDVETLEELVMLSVNDALKQAAADKEALLGRFGGMGGFGM